MIQLPVGMFITVRVPMGVPWRWDREMKMRVTSTPNQKFFIIESLEDLIRAIPAEELPGMWEVDVKAAWIVNLGPIT